MRKGIIGAIIGDIAGSSHEAKPVTRESFKLFNKQSTITDDTVLTAAVAEWLLNRETTTIEDSLRKWANDYPHAGYGSSFKRFLKSEAGSSLGSTHNGAVMRVSPVGYIANSIEECMALAKESALPSHNSEVAIKAAQATAVAIFLAREGKSKAEIRDYIEPEFGYDLHTSYEELKAEIRAARANRNELTRYASHERIVGAGTSVQDALVAFLTGVSYEDVIRKAICLGGDADTEAAIAGGIAAAYYGVPEEIIEASLLYIPSDILALVNQVDGSEWKPSKLIPPKSGRWSRHDVVICATNEDDTLGERAFRLTQPSRFNRHYNLGYPIIFDSPRVPFDEQLFLIRAKCESSKDFRWHLHDIGIESGKMTIEEFRSTFAWALELDNVLVTETLLNER